MADLNEKRVIEAALFISAREMSLEELRTLTGIGALGYIQKMVEELKKEYDERTSALEIIDVNGKYVMRIRNDYLGRVKQFAQDSEITKPALRTLAIIAKHDGILKSDLVKKMGPQAYMDVKELVKSGFVKTHKAGRTSKLTVTDKFKKYFGNVEDLKAGMVAHATVSTANEQGSAKEDVAQTKIELPAEFEAGTEEKEEGMDD
ncbi:MAG: SMC-Scp complex subunit ScpB [Candidatus Micrarchaeia archaeon]